MRSSGDVIAFLQDYLPQMFLSAVNKTFLFPPTEGGSYSGVGYVLMGMVLSAVTGADTWDMLDQADAAAGGPAAPALNHTIFMGRGPCTKYPKVVPQYMYNYQAYKLDGAAAAAANSSGTDTGNNLGGCSAGTTGYYPETAGVGRTLKVAPADSAGDCCTAAAGAAAAVGWTYTNTPFKQGGTCTFWSALYTGKHAAGATTGVVDQPIQLSDFSDLGEFSCLNGWTMGNIATAPQDVVRFYHALASCLGNQGGGGYTPRRTEKSARGQHCHCLTGMVQATHRRPLGAEAVHSCLLHALSADVRALLMTSSHSKATGKLISHDSLAQMHDYKPVAKNRNTLPLPAESLLEDAGGGMLRPPFLEGWGRRHPSGASRCGSLLVLVLFSRSADVRLC